MKSNQLLKLVPVATSPMGEIFFILNPDSEEVDGAIYQNGRFRLIPFWPYVTKKLITPLFLTSFHEQLWGSTSTAPTSGDWYETFIERRGSLPDVNTVTDLIIPIDAQSLKVTRTDSDSALSSKALPLRMEPYDPDAEDGDGDGLVQDRTPWERPAGTRILNNLGQEISRGFTATERPMGSRIVDEDGNAVDYRPKDRSPEVPDRLTPGDLPRPRSLRDAGYPTVDDRAHPERGELDAREAEEKRRAEAEKASLRAQKERVAAAKRSDDFVPPEDVRSAPGVSEESLAAFRGRVLERPERPIPPLPVAFQGKMRDWADDADGDYGALLRRLDREGYVVLDYETTGWSDGATNRPVQVGAVRMRNGRIVERFNAFVNPDEGLSNWSRENLRDADGNDLTDEWLAENGLLMRDAHARLAEFLGDSVVVGHNLPFDFDVMNRMMREGEVDFVPGGMLDTLRLTRDMLPAGDGRGRPRSHKLVDLADFYGVNKDRGPHGADVDAEITGEVLRRALRHGDTGDLDRQAIMPEMQERRFAAEYERFERRQAKYDADMREYEARVSERDEDATRGVGRVRAAVDRFRDRVRRRGRGGDEPVRSAAQRPPTPEEALGEQGKRDFDAIGAEFNGAWEKDEDGSYVYEVWSATGEIVNIPLSSVMGWREEDGRFDPEELRAYFWERGLGATDDQVTAALAEVERRFGEAGIRVQARPMFGGEWADGFPSGVDPREFHYRIVDATGEPIPTKKDSQGKLDFFLLRDFVKGKPRGLVTESEAKIVGVDVVAAPNLEKDFLDAATQSVVESQVFDGILEALKKEPGFVADEKFFRIERGPEGLTITVSAEIYGLPRTCIPLVYQVSINHEDGEARVVLSAKAPRLDERVVQRAVMDEFYDDPEFLIPVGEGFSEEVEYVAEMVADWVGRNRTSLHADILLNYHENKFYYDDLQDQWDTQAKIRDLRAQFIRGEISEEDYRLEAETERGGLSARRAERRRVMGVNRDPDDIVYPIAPGPNGKPIIDADDPFDSQISTMGTAEEFDDILAVATKAYNIDPLGIPGSPEAERVTDVLIVAEGLDPERPTNARGTFYPLSQDGGTFIEINENQKQNARDTFMHELGHRADAYTDENGLVRYYSRDSDSPAAKEFRERFEEVYADEIETRRNDPTQQIPQADGKTYFEYWTSPHEAFARVHALWLARLTGDADTWKPNSKQGKELQKAMPLFPLLEAMFAERGLAVRQEKQSSLSGERLAALEEAKAISDAAIPGAINKRNQAGRRDAGGPDLAKIGFYDENGSPILVRVPKGANGIETAGDAARHLGAGGDIRDVPDEFLLEAIEANSSTDPNADARFLKKQSEGGVNDLGHFHYKDKVTGGLFGIKFADQRKSGTPGGQENFAEVFGALLAHELGFEQGAQRILAKDDELRGDGNERERIPWLYEFLPVVGDLTALNAQIEVRDEEGMSEVFSVDEIVRGMVLNYLLANGDRHWGNAVLIGDLGGFDFALGYWDHGLAMGRRNHEYSDDVSPTLGVYLEQGDRFGYATILEEFIRREGEQGVEDIKRALREAGASLTDRVQKILESLGPDDWPGLTTYEPSSRIAEWRAQLRAELELLSGIDPNDTRLVEQQRWEIRRLERLIERGEERVKAGTRGDWRTILERARAIESMGEDDAIGLFSP